MLFAKVLITRGSMLYWKQKALAKINGSSSGWIFIVADFYESSYITISTAYYSLLFYGASQIDDQSLSQELRIFYMILWESVYMILGNFVFDLNLQIDLINQLPFIINLAFWLFYKIQILNKSLEVNLSLLMITKNDHNLSQQFISRCNKILHKQPDIYLINFINRNILSFNVNTFRSKDLPFTEIMFTLPFAQIQIFVENQSISKMKSKQNYMNEGNPKSKPRQSKKLISLFNLVSEALLNENNRNLRILKFLNIPIHLNQLQILLNSIQKAKYLKELKFYKCQLKDSHVQLLKNSLSCNVSLTSVDLSFNHLRQCGGIIGKILSQHGQRKNQIQSLYLAKNVLPEFNIANTGISQISLESNELSSKSIDDLLTFLQDDQWVRCINLKNNKLDEESIRKFMSLLNHNSTLLSLDLRQNEGLNKKYSKFIFNKLKQNLQNLKNNAQMAQPKQPLKKKQNIQNFLQANTVTSPRIQQLKNQGKKIEQQIQINPNSIRHFNKQQSMHETYENQSKEKIRTKMFINSPQGASTLSYSHSQKKSIDIQNLTQQKQRAVIKRLLTLNQTLQSKKINTTDLKESMSKHSLNKNKIQKNQFQDEMHNIECKKCSNLQIEIMRQEQKFHQMQLRALKAQKENVQLEIQLRKLKSFLAKNMDVSAIGTSSNKLNLQIPPQLNIHNSNISTSFNKLINTENEDQMISKIQILVSELTKIMQTVELFQNTQNTIEHPFQNVNSFSKTVQLYEKPKNLMEIHQEILQDQALHLQQFGQNSESLVEKSVQQYENILKIDKNQESQ